MAIDDNTSYELTGAQVKDLASKVNEKAKLTMFYASASLDSATSLYSDSGYTTAVESQDVDAALGEGVAIVRDSDGVDYVLTSADISVGGSYQTVYNNNIYQIVYEYSDDTIMSVSVKEVQSKLTAGSNITISSNTISATDTTYSDFTGATSLDAGAHGLVPAPAAGDEGKFLQGDGTWDTPTDTTYTAGTNVQISAGNVISATDTTYSAFTGATSSVAGAAGLVPAPTTSDPDKFLKGDGTWATVQAGNSSMVVYSDASMHTPESITGIYTTSALTTLVDADDMVDAIEAGDSVIVRSVPYEAVVITSYDNHDKGSPAAISFTGQFLGDWRVNEPKFIKFTYNTTLGLWSAEGIGLPTVNDATLTIQKNGTDIATFSANSSTATTANISVPTQFSDLSGTIGTSQIADGAVTSDKLANSSVTPSKLVHGYLTLADYQTSERTITTDSYSAMQSGTLVTNGGDVYVSGFVYGTRAGGGIAYLYAKIDSSLYKLSQCTLTGNAPMFGSEVISGISAGSHTVSFGVLIQPGSGRSYTLVGYSQNKVTFMEI